jgi:CSLREA domain-containing protein
VVPGGTLSGFASTDPPGADGSRVFTVNSTADGADFDLTDSVCDVDREKRGLQCTLRAAIMQANVTTAFDAIFFRIADAPGSRRIIAPVTPLPPIVAPAVINGASQPDSDSRPVEITGKRLASSLGIPGIDIRTDNVRVTRLVIHDFKGAGVAITGDANEVTNSILGIHNEFLDIRGNGYGVTITGGRENRVEDNRISANRFAGVYILLGGHNRIERNIIGLGRFAPPVSLPNGTHGIDVASSPNNLVRSNVVGPNKGYGIVIRGRDARANEVIGNFVGTDEERELAIGNRKGGILVSEAFSNLVGVSARGRVAGNVIHNNRGSGVHIDRGGLNTIQGNDIGAPFVFSGGGSGILIVDSGGNRIGGRGPAGNRVAKNQADGIVIRGALASANAISGNVIGAEGEPNRGHGIVIDGGCCNTVGDERFGNAIQFNRGAGVLVQSGRGHTILSNTFAANGGLAIDIGRPGVTANDAGDVDTGANDLQNFPVLLDLRPGGEIFGFLRSVPRTRFIVQFFLSRRCDRSGHGEGEVLIGVVTGETDATGLLAIKARMKKPIPPGRAVTATATVAVETRSTSEFSRCLRSE